MVLYYTMYTVIELYCYCYLAFLLSLTCPSGISDSGEMTPSRRLGNYSSLLAVRGEGYGRYGGEEATSG